MKPFTYKGKTVMVARNGSIYIGRKKLNQYDNGTGYKTFSLKSRLFYVQIVVCTLFHGKPPNPKMQANHKNGIRHDNRAVNLRWDTSSDNHKHAYRVLKRVHSKSQLKRSGYNHQYSKPVDQIDINTRKVIHTFGSIEEAAKFMKVCASGISASINKRARAKYCKGYDWAYNSKGNQFKPKYIYYFDGDIKKRKLNK